MERRTTKRLESKQQKARDFLRSHMCKARCVSSGEGEEEGYGDEF